MLIFSKVLIIILLWVIQSINNLVKIPEKYFSQIAA